MPRNDIFSKMRSSKKVNRALNVFRGPRKHILIACYQKSGSTYLGRVLTAITGFRNVQACAQFGNNEQDVCEHQLQRYDPIDYTCQLHVKGTDKNIDLIKQYGLKTIVQIRNIHDVVYSLRDHFAKEDHRTPTGYVHREYFDMSDDEKLLYISRIHATWYINFLVSWTEATEKLPCFWTSYEELFADQAGVISKALDFCEVPYTDQQIADAIDASTKKNTRLNVGRSGRGEQLPEACKQAIRDTAAVWKLDASLWAKIGIDADAKQPT